MSDGKIKKFVLGFARVGRHGPIVMVEWRYASHGIDGGCVPNLQWLIPMAWTVDPGKPFTITERFPSEGAS